MDEYANTKASVSKIGQKNILKEQTATTQASCLISTLNNCCSQIWSLMTTLTTFASRASAEDAQWNDYIYISHVWLAIANAQSKC